MGLSAPLRADRAATGTNVEEPTKFLVSEPGKQSWETMEVE